MKKTVPFAISIIGGIIADVASKWFVFSNLNRFSKITLIPGLLNIIRSKNEGVVFGLFPGKTNIFIILSGFAIAIILFLYIRFEKNWFASNIAMGLVLAGAIGNLWDRIRYKYVRDFIDLHIGDAYHWPTFNVADALICIGISIMIFTSFHSTKEKNSA